MKWFKANSVNNLTLDRIRQEYGLQGVGAAYLTQGMVSDTELRPEELTPELVKKWTGLKLKTIQNGLFDLLKEFCFGFKTTLNQVQNQFKVNSNSIQNDFKTISKSIQSENEHTSNPHGSTRDLEEIRIEENREDNIGDDIDLGRVREESSPPPPENEFEILFPTGEKQTEKDWLLIWLWDRHLQKYKPPVAIRTMESLLTNDQTCWQIYNQWRHWTLAERMTGFAYAARAPNANNQLLYAMKCIREPNEDFKKQLKNFDSAVKSGDYTVELE